MLRIGSRFLLGVIPIAAAAIVVWEWLTNDTVSDADDVVAAINNLSTIISSQEDLGFDDTQLETVSNALGSVSRAIAEKAPNANSATYLNVFSGAFTLSPGQSADVEAPDGTFATIAYIDDNIPGSPMINASYNGEYTRINIGDVFVVTQGCRLTYMSTTGTNNEPATFRFRCN